MIEEGIGAPIANVFETTETAPDTLPPDDNHDEWSDVDPDYRSEVYAEMPSPTYRADGVDEGIDWDRLAAERLLKRYHRLAQEEREAVQFVDDEIARTRELLEALEARRAELLRPIERKRAWLDTFKPLLESWAREALTYAKARSIKLTYGAVKFRKAPDRLEVTDEAAALAWVRDSGLPFLVRVTLDKAMAKKYIKEDGEVIPGVELVAGEDTFSVEVGP